MGASISFFQGNYSPIEGAELLILLINEKIKFLRAKCDRAKKTGQLPCEQDLSSLEQLRQAKQHIQELILSAHRRGVRLEISSSFQIRELEASGSGMQLRTVRCPE
ncbi:hypothetical protein [Croceiramulus getboli]|nr:hypothetical protein P8624_02965 [Flavobacteriaceae bacterium YJPT1-3]